MAAMQRLSLRVNGAARTVEVDPATPLLYVLRNDLELNGPKFGCGVAQCGACTVLLDGQSARSCVTPVAALQGRAVTTLEGLAIDGRPNRLQQAFIDEQAVQCGYCINGMILQATDLLERTPKPSEAQIRAALAGHLCRCGTHRRMVRAVQRASGQAVTG